MGNGVGKKCGGQEELESSPSSTAGEPFPKFSSQMCIFLNHTSVLYRLMGVLLGGDWGERHDSLQPNLRVKPHA